MRHILFLHFDCTQFATSACRNLCCSRCEGMVCDSPSASTTIGVHQNPVCQACACHEMVLWPIGRLIDHPSPHPGPSRVVQTCLPGLDPTSCFAIPSAGWHGCRYDPVGFYAYGLTRCKLGQSSVWKRHAWTFDKTHFRPQKATLQPLLFLYWLRLLLIPLLTDAICNLRERVLTSCQTCFAATVRHQLSRALKH